MSLYLVVRHLPFVFALLLKIQLERTANDRENKSALLKSVSVSVKFFGFFAHWRTTNDNDSIQSDYEP